MAKEQETAANFSELLVLTSEVVAAYVSRANVRSSEVPEIITMVYSTLRKLEQTHHVTSEAEPEVLKAAVSVRRSVTPEYIVCLEDGKKLRMLKRYLRTNYGLSPEEYRARWNLPSTYPMVAPNYAKQRSDFAKQIGLGRGVSRRGRRKANG